MTVPQFTWQLHSGKSEQILKPHTNASFLSFFECKGKHKSFAKIIINGFFSNRNILRTFQVPMGLVSVAWDYLLTTGRLASLGHDPQSKTPTVSEMLPRRQCKSPFPHTLRIVVLKSIIYLNFMFPFLNPGLQLAGKIENI